MLSYEEISKLLLAAHFHIANETSKKIALRSNLLRNPLYINKTAGTSPSTIIIHPAHESLKENLSSIKEVISHSDYWYHSSNMTLFPKRLNRGKNAIGYGIPFGFESETSLKNFIKALITDDNDESDNPFADIKAAEIQLSKVSETIREALIEARIGQGPYRKKLSEYWGGCAVTGCKSIELLIASHAKSWKKSDNYERLDHFNGLLLTPNLDKAFDKGYITFKDNREIILSSILSNSSKETLGINESMKLNKIDPKHCPYLEWHRQNIFKK